METLPATNSEQDKNIHSHRKNPELESPKKEKKKKDKKDKRKAQKT